MEKEELHSQLDFLQLYKDCLDKLSIKKEDLALAKDLIKPLMDSLLLGEDIPHVDQEKEFLSPFLLHDKVHDVYYPFFYFKVEFEKNKLRLCKELPIINNLALNLLSEIGVHLKEDFSLKDIPHCYESLEHLIIQMSALNKAELIPYFTFVDSSILEWNANYPFLNEYLFGTETNPKYDSLFKEVKSAEFEQELKENSFGFFAREQRVFKRVNHYLGTKVNFGNQNIVENFLLKTFHTFSENKETALIVAQHQSLHKIERFLKENDLTDFSMNWKSCDGKTLLEMFDQLDHRTLTSEQMTMVRHHKEKQERYLSFEDKRRTSFEGLKHLYKPSFIDVVAKNHRPKEIIDLNVENYGVGDFEKDISFFETLEKLDSVKDTYISNHPYFGLTLDDSMENHHNLQLLCINLIKKLKDFMEFYQQLDFMKQYHLSLDSIRDFERYQDAGKVLSQYNGFPRKHFKIDASKEEQYNLSVLKKAYQNVSASQLMLSNFCDKAIFDEDLANLAKLYQSRNIFKKHKAKKILAKHIKIKKEHDFDALSRIIDTYVKAKSKVSDMLPNYYEIYGDSVMTMNGVVEIESNIQYIRLFRSYEQKYPNFNIEHPFIKRFLKDKTFRIAVVQDLEQAKVFYDDIMESLNEYVGCYRDRNNQYIYELNLSELIQKLSKESMLSYDLFSQYISFREAQTNASVMLQVVLRRYMVKQIPLTSLAKDFTYSFLYQVYQSGKQSFAPYSKDYISIKEQFIESLFTEKNDDILENYQAYSQAIQDESNQDENVSLYETFKKEIQEESLEMEVHDQALRLLSKCYPITLVSEDDLYAIPDDLFDNVLVVGGEKMDNMRLLSTYRVGKKRMFLYRDVSDKRIQGYHETKINKDNLYYKAFDYSLLPSYFFEKLKKECEDSGARLVLDDERYPLIVEKNGHNYGILPNNLLTYDMDDRTMLELTRYLARFQHVYLIIFDIYAYLFDDENIFDLMK